MVSAAAENRVIANIFDNGNPTIVSIDPAGGYERKVLALDKRWVVTTAVAPDRTIVFDDIFGNHGQDIVYLPGGATNTKP